MTKIAALLPMRHNSERIPGKNYREFAGLPLYQHILNSMLACELITKNYQQDPCFFPESLVAPKPYRFVYRWFGFVSAEKLAEFKRNFLTKTKSLLPQLRFMYEKQANDLE